MRRVENITIAERALATLRAELSACRLGRGDVAVLVYVFTYTNADGTTVQGFWPGYMVGPWPADQLTDRYLELRSPGVVPFYFLPKFAWTAEARYRVDLVAPGARMFSIGPV